MRRSRRIELDQDLQPGRPGESVPAGAEGDSRRPAPLRVVHVVLSLDVGGLELVVRDLLREGQRLGQHARVLCLERPGALADEVTALGIPVTSLGKPAGLRPALVRRVRKQLREAAPDVVHTHQIGALFYAGPAALLAGRLPVVHTEHGVHYPGRLRTRVVARIAAHHAARFVCVSSDIAATAIRHRIVARRKVDVISNGIDTVRFEGCTDRDAARRSLGLPAGVPLVGTVGRLDPIKQQGSLLGAFARVRAVVPQCHLLLVGDGPAQGDLRRLAAELGIQDCVTFAGYQPRPEAYFQVMDVFALTSLSEGTPLALLEAWASGVPVVASRVGGIPELISDGWTGLLFESGDEGQLAQAILGLIADPGWSRNLGDAGRRQCRALHDVRAVADTYDGLYRRLGERRGGSPR